MGEGGPGPTFLVAAWPHATFWSTFTIQPNTTAAQAAEMTGQQLDLLFWWVPVMLPVDLVTGISSFHVGMGFLSPLTLSLLRSPHLQHMPPHTPA